MSEVESGLACIAFRSTTKKETVIIMTIIAQGATTTVRINILLLEHITAVAGVVGLVARKQLKRMPDRDTVRVLVCGGRNFTNQKLMDECLDRLFSFAKIEAVIHGAYSGADNLANKWALSREHNIIACPANWKKWGKSAGPRRNQYMLEVCKPDIVVAFPGGNGTTHMRRIAREADVKVIVVDECGNMSLDKIESTDCQSH